jgi:hypothetical protein
VEHASEEGGREPTWEEAKAALASSRPAALVRSPRKLVVEYRYCDRRWHATSPGLTGFDVSGPSLHETRQMAKEHLAGFLDPAVALDERLPSEEAETEGASRSRVVNDPPVVASSSTASRNRLVLSQSGLVAGA